MNTGHWIRRRGPGWDHRFIDRDKTHPKDSIFHGALRSKCDRVLDFGCSRATFYNRQLCGYIPRCDARSPRCCSLQLPCAEVMVPEIHFKSSIISNDTTSSLDPPSNTSQWNETGNIPYTQELCCAITWLYGRRPYRRLPLPPGPKRLPVIRSLLDMPPTRQWMTFDK